MGTRAATRAPMTEINTSPTKILPNKSPYLSYSLALLIYVVLTIVPVIGGIASFITLLVGMGAFAISKKASLAEYNK